MRLAAAALSLLAITSCKRSSNDPPNANADANADARSSAGTAAAPSAAAIGARKADAPPDEVHWVGELAPGTVERNICFSSPHPFQPIAEAAADANSFLFVARVVAQGWTQRPSPERQKVGSLYLTVVEPIRGDALRPGTSLSLPIDEAPCADGGVCTDWSTMSPGTTVVVGCSAPRPHVPHRNALLPVAGPQATLVDELRDCVKLRSGNHAESVLARKRRADAGASPTQDGGLFDHCMRAHRGPRDAGAQ